MMNRLVTIDNGTAKLTEQNIPEPQPNEVLIKHSAIGLNEIDCDIYNGKHPFIKDTIGFEGCGAIEKIGSEVEGFNQGQLVVYSSNINGNSISDYNTVNYLNIVSVPNRVTPIQAVLHLYAGMLIHSLLFRVFIVRKGDAILITNIDQYQQSLLSQWAKSLGALIIGTVSTDEKLATLDKNITGHYLAVNHNKDGWEQEVLDLTKNIGVGAVYDNEGGELTNLLTTCLMKAGILISYGFQSGMPQISIPSLAKRSLFFSTPSVFDYKSNRMEFILASNEIFERVLEGALTIKEHREFSITQYEEALNALSNKSSAIVIVP